MRKALGVGMASVSVCFRRPTCQVGDGMWVSHESKGLKVSSPTVYLQQGSMFFLSSVPHKRLFHCKDGTMEIALSIRRFITDGAPNGARI